MRREDRIAQRLQRLVEGFNVAVYAYDTLTSVNRQLTKHRATINLRREAGSVSVAVADPRFIASLRETLISWGLDRRRSRLVDENAFTSALRVAAPRLDKLELLRIDDDDLPANTPDVLWDIINTIGVVENDAKIVAGTKTLHHLLPDLVPPIDRAWTGMFFDLNQGDWQGNKQRRTFLRLYRTFVELALSAQPFHYVTGQGWRTTRTKILDNALIGYCKTELAGMSDRTDGRLIMIHVAGFPPAKNEALSMLGERHSHAPRVRALLVAARDALAAHVAFRPVSDRPISLDLVLHLGPEDDPWDATNYLGGVADVLEDKSRRGTAVAHLGELAQVSLYRNDRQIKRVVYDETTAAVTSYTVTIRVLG